MRTSKQDTFPIVITKQHASVKIYKVKPQPGRENCTYSLSYLTPEGRVRRNFVDLAEAKREADSAVAKLAKGDLEALKVTGSDARLFIDAVKELKDTGTNVLEAAREYAWAFKKLGFNGIRDAIEHYQKTVANGLPDVMVEDAADRFLAAKKGEGMSRKYIKDIQQILGARDAAKPVGETKRGGLAGAFHCLIKAVSSDQLREYIGRLKIGPVAKNNHRRVIVALFNFAKEQTPSWLPKNESTAADALKAIKVKRTPPAVYTPEEMTALIAGSSERFLPYLALVAFGGLRADEITDDAPIEGQSKGQLRWEHIDFARGVITVPAEISKTIARKIVMSDNLKKMLAPYQGRTGFIYPIYPNLDRADACENASKILYGTKEGAQRLEWKPNAHRHSFASYRLEQTKSAAQVSLEMGNSPKIVLRDYADLVHAEDAAAYWAICPEKVTEGKIIAMAPAAPTVPASASKGERHGKVAV